MECLGRHRPVPLGHEDVRGRPLFALQPGMGCTLGEPFLALLTCRRPVASSICDHCRSHSADARKPWREPIRIMVASRWPSRLDFLAAAINRSISAVVRYSRVRTEEFTVLGGDRPPLRFFTIFCPRSKPTG